MRYFKVLKEHRVYGSKGFCEDYAITQSLYVETVGDDYEEYYGKDFFDWVERCSDDDYIYLGDWDSEENGIESELDIVIQGFDGYTAEANFYKFKEITKEEYDEFKELEKLYKEQTKAYKKAFGF